MFIQCMHMHAYRITHTISYCLPRLFTFSILNPECHMETQRLFMKITLISGGIKIYLYTLKYYFIFVDDGDEDSVASNEFHFNIREF